MAGMVGIALRGFGKALGKLGKKKINRGEGAIKSVKPGKQLTKKRKLQDQVVGDRDKIYRDYKISDKNKVELRKKANQPKINKKIADIADRQDKARVKKMGGGMMGRRFGMKKGGRGGMGKAMRGGGCVR